MEKKFMKYSILTVAGIMLGVIVSSITNVFGAPADPLTLETIINTACIEYTTSSGTAIKCDDAEIYYAEDVYPVKKWQKTSDMDDFTDQEITVGLGEYILYKVDFVNLGDKNLVGTVKDYLPNCITFVTGSVHGDGISNAVFEHNSDYTQVRFRGISLSPGWSGYMLVTGQVSNGGNCQTVTRYVNTGSFKSTNPSGTELFDSVVAERDDGEPKLNVDKKLLTTGYLEAGDPVVYKITVRNVGSGTATGVLIYDELPIQIQYQTSSISVPSYSTYYFMTGTTGQTIYIEYTGITLQPDGRAIVYLTGIIKEGHTFDENTKNCAIVSGSNVQQVEDCVTPKLPKIYMEKELLTTGNLVAGNKVAYKITVWNSGLAAETNLMVYDELPIQIYYQTSSIAVPSYSTYHFMTGTTGQTVYIEYTGITLQPGGMAVVYLTGIIKEGHVFNENAENCAVVLGDNTQRIRDCVTPGPKPEIHMVKELLTTGYLTAGNKVVYKITTWNSGLAAETNLMVYDELPIQIYYQTSSIVVPSYSTYHFMTGTTGQTVYIEYTGITLQPGGMAVVYLTGIIKEGHTFNENTENCAVVLGDNTQRIRNCVTPTPPPSLTSGDIVITKSVNKSSVKKGDVVRYTINYHNKSDWPLTNYTIVDTWPSQLIFSGANPREDWSGGNKIKWTTLPQLEPHTTGTIVITGVVK